MAKWREGEGAKWREGERAKWAKWVRRLNGEMGEMAKGRKGEMAKWAKWRKGLKGEGAIFLLKHLHISEKSSTFAASISKHS